MFFKGDKDGLEKDYSSTGESSSDSEPDTSKFEEKYKEKGIDEEEAIKALDKSESESESDDEGLTEEGKEYRKLMTKGDRDKDNDEFDELLKGKSGKNDGNMFILFTIEMEFFCHFEKISYLNFLVLK